MLPTKQDELQQQWQLYHVPRGHQKHDQLLALQYRKHMYHVTQYGQHDMSGDAGATVGDFTAAVREWDRGAGGRLRPRAEQQLDLLRCQDVQAPSGGGMRSVEWPVLPVELPVLQLTAGLPACR